ncbi:MAG: glycosyltransferase family 2 protein [Proteobacteria bacterium]|nr:glycosyltransferase family 2 protein [Pseudomonadota bacterium]MBI3499639.1 glycosyltransferase family 2 protein [Pseudomonadota bacterium]
MSAAPLEGTSVIVVSYRTGPALRDCVESVLAQEGLAELIVVDNGNPAESLAWLGQRALADRRLRILSGHGNVGFAAGCNRGVAASGGAIILLLNPDCVLAEGTLSRGAALLAGHPGAALLGGRLVNPDGSDQRGGRRHLLTPGSAIIEALRLDRLIPGVKRVNRHEEPLPEAAIPVDCISGAFMLMPRPVFETVGGMDEGYFLHVEDADFCLRVGRQAGSILFAPDILVRHRQGTSAAPAILVEWHKARGFIRYFHKHFRSSHGLAILALVDLLVLARFAVRGLVMGLFRAMARPGLIALPLLAIL